MTAQMKHTLAALLAATVIVTPAAAEPKGGKDRGAQGGGHEQSRGGGGGDSQGGGGKHRDAHQPAKVINRAAPAPRQAVEARGNGKGKQLRQERSAPIGMFADAARSQKHESPEPKRWERGRQPQPASRAGFDARTDRGKRKAVSYAVNHQRDSSPQPSRKFEKQVVKQQRAAYRAEVEQQRQWSKHQRQAFKQAATIVPVLVYQQSIDGYPRAERYADEPNYRISAIRAFPSYATYTEPYDYTARYLGADAYSHGGWTYPQSYSEWTASPSYASYAPYDAGYDNGGLGGLFGGGGGLGNILVALLPLLFGDSLGLAGLTDGSLGAGLLGSSTPGSAGVYERNEYPAVAYAEPGYSYQDASTGHGVLGADQNLFGGDGLMALLPLALQSGILGGDSGSFGGLGGLGGGLGLGDGHGLSSPNNVYAAPYASNAGLLNAFGV